MSRILSAGLTAMLLVWSVAEVRAQDEGQLRPEQSSIDRSSVREDPVVSVRIQPHPLFVVELRTNLSLRGTCYYYVEDPCPFVEQEIVDFARNELLEESASLLGSMLQETGFEDKLRQSISYRLRQELLALRRENSHLPLPPPPPPPPPCSCQEFRRPDMRRMLLGTLMFAGGGVLSASKNEWAIDEGFVGVGIAAVGLGVVFKQLVPEWRGAKISSSGANLSIAW